MLETSKLLSALLPLCLVAAGGCASSSSPAQPAPLGTVVYRISSDWQTLDPQKAISSSTWQDMPMTLQERICPRCAEGATHG